MQVSSQRPGVHRNSSYKRVKGERVNPQHPPAYGLVSLGLRCFLRLDRALCWRSGQCLADVAFSV